MQFTYPNFLWALALIIVPILIHFLNLRRHHTVYFSNVSFLKQVKRDIKKRSQLKQLLILLSRILAITALVLAFAKPYQPIGKETNLQISSVKCIYIDNSFSMNAESSSGVALEFAKNKAIQIIRSSNPASKFAILTNNFDQRYYRFYSATEAIKQIGETQTTFKQVPISKAISRFKGMISSLLQSNINNIYLISDFQKCTADIENLKPDSSTIFNFIAVDIKNQSNIYIDTCWFTSPTHHLNQEEQLAVNIVNSAGSDLHQFSVKLFINDTLQTMTTIELPEGETTQVLLNYKNNSIGNKNGKVEISDYPIVYDNQLFFNYFVKKELKALEVNQSENIQQNALAALFKNDDYIKLEQSNIKRIQISKLNDYNAIFLNKLNSISTGFQSALKDYLNHGGTIIIIPNLSNLQNANRYSTAIGGLNYLYKDTSSVPISKINFEDQIFMNVFKKLSNQLEYPIIDERIRMYDPVGKASTILGFADNTQALTRMKVDNGFVYNFAFDTDLDQYAKHVLFVPSFYNLVLYASEKQEIYHNIGQQNFLSINNKNKIQTSQIKIQNKESGLEWKPEILNNMGNRISIQLNENLEAGFYNVISNNNLQGSFALNFNHTESEMEFLSQAKITTQLNVIGLENYNFIETNSSNIESSLSALENGKQFWKLFIFFALFFLVAELFIARFIR